ncbi:hypothetical protein POVWA2_050490 [Plasmodium ovale wallikeri]|uniref:Uncharacterized protein n=1 Tax=Plasmodium ovale wallikeri TaxID=864142 RepID=A0A1A8ZMQ3_PLAOA|nr:hypothetical protein POVWA1_051240 [Plasmodium ovale wallikeri]SBT45671.1 hypothetical protein POVWA2_050490 [Plasmodium ovale wallikeri]
MRTLQYTVLKGIKKRRACICKQKRVKLVGERREYLHILRVLSPTLFCKLQPVTTHKELKPHMCYFSWFPTLVPPAIRNFLKKIRSARKEVKKRVHTSRRRNDKLKGAQGPGEPLDIAIILRGLW